MAWNDERVELLKKLWSEGLSASQIAGRLGGVTRNAVIGKVHRLGLCRARHHFAHEEPPPRRALPRGSRQAHGEDALRPRSAIRPCARSTSPEAEPFIRRPSRSSSSRWPRRKSIQTLTECSCRWPIGDPQAGDFHFCGKNKVPGLPYCEFHARRAFQPPQPRRRDREIGERTPAIAAQPPAHRKEPAGA